MEVGKVNKDQEYKKGKLSSDRAGRLEEIGFIWDRRSFTGVFEKGYEKGYQETLKYKEQSGDANAPVNYKTPEGYNLGIWQSKQRSEHKKGMLSSGRVGKLEEIGFIWDQSAATFEQGYQETLNYKKQYGDANAPWNHILPDGFDLGIWQIRQRSEYCVGRLDPEKIRKLEGIGFKWILKSKKE